MTKGARGTAIQLAGIVVALTAASTALFIHTVGVRLRRDVARLVLDLHIFQRKLPFF